MTNSDFLPPLEEDLLDLADELSFADLLEIPEVSAFTIRMIAGLRKRLLEADSRELNSMKAEQLVSKIYYKIGHDRRSAAFGEGSTHKNATTRSTTPPIERQLPQKIEPVALEAKRLNSTRALDICKAVIMTLKEKGSETFTFKSLCDDVMDVYTEGGSLKLCSEDLVITSSNQSRFVQTIAGAVQKLRNEDLVHYRTSKKHYIIF